MTAYVIAGSEFMEGGPIYMHDGGPSEAKRKAVLLPLTMRSVGTECASAFRLQTETLCKLQMCYFVTKKWTRTFSGAAVCIVKLLYNLIQNEFKKSFHFTYNNLVFQLKEII